MSLIPGSQISTHAPLARCDTLEMEYNNGIKISTHAPLARCDNRWLAVRSLSGRFQLTHLLRGATARGYGSGEPVEFQLTHLLRGATLAASGYSDFSSYFNSRTSCEVRPSRIAKTKGLANFNSRTSCEVRLAGEREKKRRRISTHAPLARCDPIRIRYLVIPAHFNSRTSCEVRRQSSNSRSSTI